MTIRNLHLANGWISLEVEGEVDLATVEELEKAMEGVYGGGTESLVVDLTGTSFMDSTGLRALVMANRRFYEGGRSFAVAVSGGPVSRLIDLSGVNTSIHIVDNTDELEDARSA